MSLAICSLASGSSGNCYLVKSNNTSLLVDAGISGRQIALKLEQLGQSRPDAVLVTHEHVDHTKGLKALSKEGVVIYLNDATMAGLSENLSEDCRVISFNTGDLFSLGDIEVKSFSVSHDAADPVGFSFSHNGKCISIVTDTGCITEACLEAMQRADILVLEANHDEAILRIGRYPWFLKQRILSDTGHLSNDAAAEALVRALKEEGEEASSRPKQILLAHLSRENNFPDMALRTFENVLAESGFNENKNIKIATLERNQISAIYAI